MTHSPGPWRILGVENGIDCGHRRFSDGIVDANENPVLAFYPSNGEYDGALFGDGIETIEANARLIAAAPELLAALRAVVDRDLSYFCGYVLHGLIPMDAIKHARAAIDKATAP